MKILIYGAGVIGSIFASKLSLSGHDVTVLARGKRLEEIRQSGILLCRPDTGKIETVRVKTINFLPEDLLFDFIFVVMKRTQVEEVLEPLSLNRSPNIVFVVNTASGYEHWLQAVGKDRLMIGFPAAGGERRDGIIHYFIFRGASRLFQTTTFGEPGGIRTRRAETVIRIFNRAGIPSAFCSRMDAWQKTHVALVTSIANALYGYGCDNRRLAASDSGLTEMVLAVKEGFHVLQNLGIQPTPNKMSVFFLPAPVLTLAFKLIMNTQFAEFTMAKHCITARDEMISLQAELDRLIEKSGISTPYINHLKKNLILHP